MATPKRNIEQPKRRSRPAMTPEARENQLISKAYDLVERRLSEGTATSQETTFFLKLGSSKERLEKEAIRQKNDLMKEKTEALKSAKRIEDLYTKAIDAMRIYSGHGGDDYD